MKSGVKPWILPILLLIASCQSPSLRRSPAQSIDHFSDNDGNYYQQVLHEEYALPKEMLTSASPRNSKNKPYIEFEKKYGLKDQKFNSEEEDFAEQAQRIHVVQLLNAGVSAKEIKYLAKVKKVDFTDLKTVVREINEKRKKDGVKDSRKLLTPQKIIRGFHAKSHGCFKADFKVFDNPEFRLYLDQYRNANPVLNYSIYNKSDLELF